MAAAAAEPAPYLKEFFDFQISQMKKTQEAIMPLIFDREALQAKVAELKAEMQKTTTPILEKSFDHHDTKRTGVLDPEEAAVFFDHFVGKQGQFLEAILQQAIMNSIEQVSQMFGGSLEGEEKDKMMEKVDAATKDAMDMIHELLKEFEKEYHENKEERDAAAFAQMDVNCDGTLTRDEFLAIFQDELKMKALVVAFGWQESKVAEKLGPMMQQMMQKLKQ